MTAWFASNMAWASLAMLVVLVIRQPVARLFGAGPAYALWLLPVLRLLAPPLPDFAPDITPTLPSLTMIVSVAEEAAPLPPDGGPGQWVPVLLAIWAGGAAVFLIWQVFAYRAFLARLEAGARPRGDHRGLPLIESPAAEGPIALGLLRRRIIVPADFDARYSPVERRLALEHECVHHRRGDIWWNHAGLFILALNWFNPLAWAAFRAFRADQELACDAVVAAAAGPDERLDYARALIKSASRPGLVAACPLNHADQLKRRLKMMKTHKVSRLRLLGGAGAVALLAAASLSVGAPSFAHPAPDAKTGASAEPQRDERVRVIIRHGDGDSDGDPAAHGGHRTRERVIIREHHRGEAGDHAARSDHTRHREYAARIEGCRQGNREMARAEDSQGNRRMRFVLCGPGNMDPARQLTALERAREAIAGEDDLSAEGRQRALTSIDAEIARLRAR